MTLLLSFPVDGWFTLRVWYYKYRMSVNSRGSPFTSSDSVIEGVVFGLP